MLTIRQRQWTSIAKDRRSHFVDETTLYLMGRFAEPGAEPAFATVREEVNAVVRTGEGWGLASAHTLLQHVLASRVIGVDYADVVASVGQVVRARHLSDEVKGQWLEGWLATVERQGLGVK